MDDCDNVISLKDIDSNETINIDDATGNNMVSTGSVGHTVNACSEDPFIFPSFTHLYPQKLSK